MWVIWIDFRVEDRGSRVEGFRVEESASSARPDTLHPTPYTLHPTPYTLHPTPYTPHSTPYTLHSVSLGSWQGETPEFRVYGCF